MLLKDYYQIMARRQEGEVAIFDISLLPDSKVYEGHFPGYAVSPGVCNIEMLKECAEHVAGLPLRIKEMKSCRLTTLVRPETHPMAEVRIQLEKTEDNYILNATLGKDDETYLSMKATLVAE
mgnify:CR=1 FL=1